MDTSQTTPPSTDLVYTEPALTAELLDRFDTFAREVALHDGVSAFSEQTRIELTKALRERTLTTPRLFLAEDGGTRTVDVHVRRLRSKLGTEHEQMISTVRNVGYSFNSTS